MYTIPQKHNKNDYQSWLKIFKQIQHYSSELINLLDLNNDLCLRSPVDEFTYGTSIVSPATINKCNINNNKLQDLFVITSDGEIMTNENICLDSLIMDNDINSLTTENSTIVRFFQCYKNIRQQWIYDLTVS